ncbi:23S rRNA (uracil(747)-C(5))-methyltransferase RlmC [Georgenia subflava]|uniref:23S rRNA (Uracil(747)-C(5))-methyltransferase RlmC n=1 Tax=Georgenia subflava TaxID=1622177 RepID=A0A6N7EQU6_9MICO|nr:23S rRNA (uracil(747)-C(5))-methyltransferase RlmC [Georgenia subflava]MPV38895.1 23S rRNA (uracil(747)-C(5))-methyltransferase RlmC [Georgenia subflava]
MHCSYFDAGRCRSCTLMGQPYAVQLTAKDRRCRELLADHDGLRWLPPVSGPESGFRNKAKMVVAGTVEQPTLGILDEAGAGVDLRGCGLYPLDLQAVLPVLASFVTRAGLTPYDVSRRRGELKHLIVTQSPDGELMVRFVLRTDEPVVRIRKHLPALRHELPALAVASVNLLPEHKAVLEGDREILLTEASALRMHVNDVDLHLRPQGFFQTNTAVAAALYRQGRAWVDDAGPRSVWDLYCGVGGFALHCAAPDRDVVGIETSEQAVEAARLSAAEARLDGVSFRAGDATAFAVGAGAAPDLVIVNPPRRGIGAELAGWLESSDVAHVLYSSCNAESLARDLAAMPSLVPRRAQLFDMFPQTAHHEVLVQLERA